MKKIIEDVFLDSDFYINKSIELINSDTFFVGSNESERTNYFLVIFLNEDSLVGFIKDELPNLLNGLKEYPFYQADMEKNTSLIVCLNKNGKVDEKLQKKVYELEEDPYDFKKYLLIYTDEEINSLNSEIGMNENASGIVEYLNNILLDTNRFNFFKSQGNDSVYDLITKIFIKLPFIKIDINEEKEMEDIQEIIKSKVLQKNIQELMNYQIEYIRYGELLIDKEEEEEEILKNLYGREGIKIE